MQQVQGTVVQVSVSRGGIPKIPVLGAMATVRGLDGDSCAHPQFHGGPNQALLIQTHEATADLIAQGFPLFDGALGENITVSGVDRMQFRIGQRWRIGQQVWVELTKIRVPCKALNVYGEGTVQKAVYDKQVKAGDFTSPLWAKAGIYARVMTPGFIAPGDAFALAEELA